MKRTPIEKISISPERKQMYKNLHAWLKLHPEIEFKKLNPIGFSINVGTIPDDLIEEFLVISTYDEKN